MRHERLRPSFETPRNGAAPQDEGEKNYVNPIFTTFMRVRFTNAFDVIARNRRSACVWRGRIAD
jgi:hypothetical protein